MSPPELARNAPVFDGFHPVTIGVFEFGRMKLNGVVHHHLQSRRGQRGHLQKPLRREFGFYHHIGTFGIAHLVGVVLFFFEQVGGFKVLHNLFAQVEAVHAGIEAHLVVDAAVGFKYVDNFQLVFKPYLVVVDVVGRRDFKAARTKFGVDVSVGDDGDFAIDNGHAQFGVVPRAVSRVVGMNAHGHVAQNGFGTGGGHNEIFARLTHHLIAQIVEFAVHFFVDDFFVGKGGEGFGVPVHHTHPAIDEPFFVEPHKHIDYGIVAAGVHGKARAVPIARRAQAAELLKNNAAVFFFPLPGVGQKFFAREVFFVDALFFEPRHHLGFSGNGSVVEPRHPAGVFALHAGAAHQHVLNGVVEHVPHVQNARNVGRRNNHRIGCALGIDFRMKAAMFQPIVIPLLLYFGGRIFCRECILFHKASVCLRLCSFSHRRIITLALGLSKTLLKTRKVSENRKKMQEGRLGFWD